MAAAAAAAVTTPAPLLQSPPTPTITIIIRTTPISTTTITIIIKTSCYSFSSTSNAIATPTSFVPFSIILRWKYNAENSNNFDHYPTPNTINITLCLGIYLGHYRAKIVGKTIGEDLCMWNKKDQCLPLPLRQLKVTPL